MSSHIMRPKGSTLVSFAELQALPMPEVLGSRHKPVTHVELIETARVCLSATGFEIVQETMAINDSGRGLMFTIDTALRSAGGDFAFSLVGRNSVAQKLCVLLGIGIHVFICDNRCVKADFWPLKHKNTSGLDLLSSMMVGVRQFMQTIPAMEQECDRRKAFGLTDDAFRLLVYRQMTSNEWPSRLLPDIDAEYFSDAHADKHGRGTLWSAENAFTAVAKQLQPMPRERGLRYLDASLQRIS